MKTCYVCKTEKPLSQFGFHRNRKDGKQTYCMDCAKINQTKWYYSRKFGISIEERDELLRKQDGRCAICKKFINFTEQGRGQKTGNDAVIDHCHGKGHIRGVLCGYCNTGLGSFKDDLHNLAEAFLYIQNDLDTGKN